jgi:cbb3-type cytochrome oxidase maturation protein
VTALSPESAFLVMWTGYLVLGLIFAVAVLVWAIRSGQFEDQDRARYLPLRSGIPPKDGPKGVPPGPDRRTDADAPRGGSLKRP